MISNYINTKVFLKILLTIAIALLFCTLFMFKVKLAVTISILFAITAISWHLFDYISDEYFFLFILFLFPIVPTSFGIVLPAGLPVIKSHRILTMLILFYMLKKRILIDYYSNFFKQNTFTFPIIIVIISYFISSSFSASKGTSFFFTISTIIETILLAIIVFNSFKTNSQINRLIYTLSISCIILAFIGLIEKKTGYNFYAQFGGFTHYYSTNHAMRGGEIRINASFGHSITLGTYYAMILPLVLYTFRKNILKSFAWSGLIFLAILATQARSAQIGALIVFIIYFLFLDRKKLRIGIILALPLIFLFHEKIISYAIQINPFNTTDANLADSSGARLEQLNFLWPFIKNNIIIGHGVGPVPALMRGSWIGGEGNYQVTVDSFYLLHFYYFGIIGILTWLYLMLETFRRPLKTFRIAIHKTPILPYILMGLIVFNIVNIVAALQQFHFVYWIFVGILARMIINKKNDLLQPQTPVTQEQ